MDHLHQQANGATAPESSEASSTGYTCPMHPDVHSPQPGNCPKCGMVLVPVV